MNTLSDPDLTPAEEQVRRLLADARHTEPMPEDVADRLDRALEHLRSEPPPRRTPPPDELAARRRRQIVRNILVAAAAVVVVGVGISRVDLSGTSNDADGGSADSSVAESDPKAADAGGDRALVDGAVVLRSETFDRQVRRLAAEQGLIGTAPGGAELAPGCDDTAWGAGERVPVEYDGQPGVLVLRAPAGDTRTVDLFLCGDTAATRSVTIPVG